MSRCTSCNNAVTAKNQAVYCEGMCKKQFHLGCIGASNDLLSVLKDVPGLSWKCISCRDLQEILDNEKLHEIFEEKITSFFDELNLINCSHQSNQIS